MLHECARCGIRPGHVFEECTICGPVILCAECAAYHRLECAVEWLMGETDHV